MPRKAERVFLSPAREERLSNRRQEHLADAGKTNLIGRKDFGPLSAVHPDRPTSKDVALARVCISGF
jgi:hypothetical protein